MGKSRKPSEPAPSSNIHVGCYEGYHFLGSNEIRLVELYPGDNESFIQLHLRQNVPLARHLNYTALSYTWGDLNDTEAVRIGDVEVLLTRSLVSFLRCQRKQLKTEFWLFWVDAICINQIDPKEKAQQIPLMRQIYEYAALTLVWLGDANYETKIALDFVVAVERDVPRSSEWGEDDIGATSWLQNEHNKLVFKISLWPLLSLLSAPWFSRTWTIQEFILSGTVLGKCGDYSFKLLDFIHTQSLIAHPLGMALVREVISEQGNESERDIRFQFANMRRSMDLLRYLQAGWRVKNSNKAGHLSRFEILLELLWQFRDNGVTDPRDKIYGILGLVEKIANENGNQTVEPQWIGLYSPIVLVDYEATTPEVYKAVASAVLQKTQKLDILSASQSSKMAGLPSWTPDWSQQWAPRSLLRMKTTGGSRGIVGKHFAATGDSKAIFRFSDNQEWLHVHGVRVDQVTDVWRPLFKREGRNWVIDSKNSTKHCLRSAQKWRSQQPRGVYKTREAAIEAHWRSLMGYDEFEATDQDTVAIPRETSVRGYENWMTSIGEPWEFIRSTSATMQGRTTMVSKKGYIISGPDSAYAGVYIYLLLGCSVPMILKPHWTHWELVGECYSSDLMNGDYWNSLPAGMDTIKELDLH